MDRLRAWIRGLVTPWDAALAVALAASAGYSSWFGEAANPHLRALLSTVAVLGLLVRVTHPDASAVWLSAFLVLESLTTESPDEIGLLLAIIVGAYSVWAHAPARRAWVGTLALAIAVTVTVAVDPSDSISNVLPTLLLFVAVPGGIGWGVYRRSSAIAALELETVALTREAEESLEDERRRIARELHDVVSHAVTLIAVQAEAGQAVIDRDPTAAKRSLESIGNASRDALGELHRMLGLLHRDEGDAEASLARVPALVDGARAAGLDVSLAVLGDARTLDHLAEHCAYRVVQEGVTNALRHSPGANVTIDLAYGPEALDLTVLSVGRRHSSAYGGTGRGLAGLRERLTGIGGTLEVERPDDTSFRLSACVPTSPAVAP